MQMHKLVPFTLSIAVILGIIIFMAGATGCANIIPPTGGPRDSLPPVLVSALPKDSTLHFTGKKVTLTFNEYVQLDNNMNDNLIVSPYPESVPTVDSKLRVVSVLLRDSLKPNTTYSINFGKGIKDVNEGNIARNLTYVFSTGDHIDNGTLAGNVILAETGKKDSTLLVELHNNLNDTSIRKNNPVYITRLDSAGNFRFRYIAPGTYNVFVLPNDYSKKYDDSTKMFAFLDEPVKIDSAATQTIKLYAYREFKPSDKKQGPKPLPKKPNPKDLPKLKVTTSLSNGPQDLLSPLAIIATAPLAGFDSTKIVLSDTNYIPVKGYTFSADTIATTYNIKYRWAENTPYKLVIQKDALKDSFGTTLEKNDTINFKTRREGEYGSIRLHFNNLALARHPVLLLMQGEKIMKSVPLKTAEWYQPLFKPGDYDIRVLYDDNRDGVWTPGSYNKRLQPEKVDVIPRKLIIKANTENDVDINL